MEKPLDLKKIVDSILAINKEKGGLTEEELFEALDQYNLSQEDFDEILLALKKKGVEQKEEKFERLSAPINDPLNLYYNEMGKYPRLSEEETLALFKTYQNLPKLEKELEEAKKANKDVSPIEKGIQEAIEAKNKIILGNLRLVVYVAKKYQNVRNLPLIDIIQEGNIGLERAVEKFDPEKGFQFSTYAHWWIKQAVLHALTVEARPIRIPTRLLNNYRIVQKEKDAFTSSKGRAPSDEELSKITKLSPKEIEECSFLPLNTLSIDAPISEDGDEFSSIIKDPSEEETPSSLGEEENEKVVDEALYALNDREKDIIARSFGLAEKEPESLESIGKSYGITRERVRQLREHALLKMRKKIEK